MAAAASGNHALALAMLQGGAAGVTNNTTVIFQQTHYLLPNKSTVNAGKYCFDDMLRPRYY
jgi:hypothetical protein